MQITGCRREAPPHGYTLTGIEGRYLASRIYPCAMGLVRGGEWDGVVLLQKWPRRWRVPTGNEAGRLWQHPIIRDLRLLAAIGHWPPNAVRCQLTQRSRSLRRREVAHGR